MFPSAKQRREELSMEIDFRMHDLMLDLANEWETSKFDWNFELLCAYMRAAFGKGYTEALRDKGELAQRFRNLK